MDTILIVDDHPIVRRGIRELLEEIPGLSVVGEANDAIEALRCVKEQTPTLMSIDISLPGEDGISLLKKVTEIDQNIRCIILSAHPMEYYAEQAYKYGAWGYLNKADLEDELKQALIRIMDGHKYISSRFADVIVGMLGKPDGADAYISLSERELQVFRALATGKSMKEIGHLLKISPQTASTYRKRLFDKLGLNSNAELARYALTHKLID